MFSDKLRQQKRARAREHETRRRRSSLLPFVRVSSFPFSSSATLASSTFFPFLLAAISCRSSSSCLSYEEVAQPTDRRRQEKKSAKTQFSHFHFHTQPFRAKSFLWATEFSHISRISESGGVQFNENIRLDTTDFFVVSSEFYFWYQQQRHTILTTKKN